MIGTFIYYHRPLYNFHKQYGVIVHVNEHSYGVCIPKFGGAINTIMKNDVHLALDPEMTPEHKISILSDFGLDWYAEYRTIFQQHLFECIRDRQGAEQKLQ